MGHGKKFFADGASVPLKLMSSTPVRAGLTEALAQAG